MLKFIDPNLDKIYTTLTENDRLIAALNKDQLILKKEMLYADYDKNILQQMESQIFMDNVNTFYALAALLLKNHDKIFDTEIPILIDGKFLFDEIKTVFGEMDISETTYHEIFYCYKYCTVSSFFQNNVEHFIPEYDLQKIEENEIASGFMDTVNKEFDKLDYTLSACREFQSFDEIDFKYINYLAQLFGFETKIFYEASERKYRSLLNNIIEIYRIRGTNYSFELFFSFLGFNIQIKEFYFDRRLWYRSNSYNEETDTSDIYKLEYYLTVVNPMKNAIKDVTIAEVCNFNDITPQYSLFDFEDLIKEHGPECVLGYSPVDKNGEVYTDKIFKYFKTNYVYYQIGLSNKNLTGDQIAAVRKYLEFLTPAYIMKVLRVDVIGDNDDDMIRFDGDGEGDGSTWGEEDSSFLIDSQDWTMWNDDHRSDTNGYISISRPEDYGNPRNPHEDESSQLYNSNEPEHFAERLPLRLHWSHISANKYLGRNGATRMKWKRLYLFYDDVGQVVLPPGDLRIPNHPKWHIDVPPFGATISQGDRNTLEWYDIDWNAKNNPYSKSVGTDNNRNVLTTVSADEMQKTKDDYDGNPYNSTTKDTTVKEWVHNNNYYEKIDFCVDGDLEDFFNNDEEFNKLTLIQSNTLHFIDVSQYRNNTSYTNFIGSFYPSKEGDYSSLTFAKNGDEFSIIGDGIVGDFDWHTGDKLTIVINVVGEFDASINSNYADLANAKTGEIYNIIGRGTIYETLWGVNEKLLILNDHPTSDADVAHYYMNDSNIKQEVSTVLDHQIKQVYQISYVYTNMSDFYSSLSNRNKDEYERIIEGSYVVVYNGASGKNVWEIKKLLTETNMLSGNYSLTLIASTIGRQDSVWVYWPLNPLDPEPISIESNFIQAEINVRTYDDGIEFINKRLNDIRTDTMITELEKKIAVNKLLHSLVYEISSNTYYFISKQTNPTQFTLTYRNHSGRNYIFSKIDDAVMFDQDGMIYNGYFYDYPDEVYNMVEFYVNGEQDVTKNGLYRFVYKNRKIGASIYSVKDGQYYRLLRGITADTVDITNFYGHLIVNEDRSQARIYEYDSHYKHYEEMADEDDFIFYNNIRESIGVPYIHRYMGTSYYFNYDYSSFPYQPVTYEIEEEKFHEYYRYNPKHYVNFKNIEKYINRPIYEQMREHFDVLKDGAFLVQYIGERTVDRFNQEEQHRRSPLEFPNTLFSLAAAIEMIVEQEDPALDNTMVSYYGSISQFVTDYYKYIVHKIHPTIEDSTKLRNILGDYNEDTNSYEHEGNYRSALIAVRNMVNNFIGRKNVGWNKEALDLGFIPQIVFDVDGGDINVNPYARYEKGISGTKLKYQEDYESYKAPYSDQYDFTNQNIVDTPYKDYLLQYTNWYLEWESIYHEFLSLCNVMLSEDPDQADSYITSWWYREELSRYREVYFDDNKGFDLNFIDFNPQPAYPDLRALYDGRSGSYRFQNILPLSRANIGQLTYIDLPIYAFELTSFQNINGNSVAFDEFPVSFYVTQLDFINKMGFFYDEQIAVINYINGRPDIDVNQKLILKPIMLDLYRRLIRSINPKFNFWDTSLGLNQDAFNFQNNEELKAAMEDEFDAIRIRSDATGKYYIISVNAKNPETYNNGNYRNEMLPKKWFWTYSYNQTKHQSPIGYMRVHFLRNWYKDNIISKPDVSKYPWLFKTEDGLPDEFNSLGETNFHYYEIENAIFKKDEDREEYKEKFTVWQDGKPVNAEVKKDLNNNLYYYDGNLKKEIKKYIEDFKVLEDGTMSITTGNLRLGNIIELLLNFEMDPIDFVEYKSIKHLLKIIMQLLIIHEWNDNTSILYNYINNVAWNVGVLFDKEQIEHNAVIDYYFTMMLILASAVQINIKIDQVIAIVNDFFITDTVVKLKVLNDKMQKIIYLNDFEKFILWLKLKMDIIIEWPILQYTILGFQSLKEVFETRVFFTPIKEDIGIWTYPSLLMNMWCAKGGRKFTIAIVALNSVTGNFDNYYVKCRGGKDGYLHELNSDEFIYTYAYSMVPPPPGSTKDQVGLFEDYGLCRIKYSIPTRMAADAYWFGWYFRDWHITDEEEWQHDYMQFKLENYISECLGNITFEYYYENYAHNGGVPDEDLGRDVWGNIPKYPLFYVPCFYYTGIDFLNVHMFNGKNEIKTYITEGYKLGDVVNLKDRQPVIICSIREKVNIPMSLRNERPTIICSIKEGFNIIINFEDNHSVIISSIEEGLNIVV